MKRASYPARNARDRADHLEDALVSVFSSISALEKTSSFTERGVHVTRLRALQSVQHELREQRDAMRAELEAGDLRSSFEDFRENLRREVAVNGAASSRAQRLAVIVMQLESLVADGEKP